MVIGYTAGVFDLFHIGHLNILRNSKALCDRLIVGVSTDELVQETKNKQPTIPFIERCEIIRAIKYVDVVVAQDDISKLAMWHKIGFNIIFVGDDWQGKWEGIAEQFAKRSVEIVYFPYTKGTSSTLINEILKR